jgi:5-methylcytosine-specific restriction endonuclease McrA
MVVYVISKNGKPLMPCSCYRARKLLERGRAKVVSRTPFTIKLLYDSTEDTQPLTLGVDAGSKTAGFAVSDDEGNVYYSSEVELRQDINKKMDRRREYRRNRRYRKTRGRKARFNNRKNSTKKGRIPPTIRSKVDAHLREIEFIKSILPITEVIYEGGEFNTTAMEHPEVLEDKTLYQHGRNYGYANTKAYVRNRDNYICQHCGCKIGQLDCHHIIFRENGGSDHADNLIVLCHACHVKLHKGNISLKLKGKKKDIVFHATHLNSVRVQLGKRIGDIIETYGFVTSEHRLMHSLSKAHFIDAALIATRGKLPIFVNNVLLEKKCVSDGDYQQTKGMHSEQKIETGKIRGFRKFDKVRYLGKEYFIKGRMSAGYAILMDIHGKKQELKPIPKFGLMKRVSARKSVLVQSKVITDEMVSLG